MIDSVKKGTEALKQDPSKTDKTPADHRPHKCTDNVSYLYNLD